MNASSRGMPAPQDSADRFLAVCRNDLRQRGWDALDIVLVSGDAYVDSPFSGVALIGRVLTARGYRVGIIAQPDCDGLDDIRRLGAPRLFWGVSAGCVDSMVANYTASGKKRRRDDFTSGGVNSRRPDRACIQYANLIRRAFRPCAPIVLGGIEASLRRIAHYDFWSDRVRRSVLLDAKADVLVYGMGERTICELADRLRAGKSWRNLSGICYAASEPPAGALHLPGFQEVEPAARRDSSAATQEAGQAFLRMTRIFFEQQEWPAGRTLAQEHDARWLVHNPPSKPLESAELDSVYELPFTREAHPRELSNGSIPALATIRFAITSHRGCYGECNFCAIAAHQGRRVISRSPESILAEARSLTQHPRFNGIVSDVGGPTANMYGIECRKMASQGACRERRCLYPEICARLKPDHRAQIEMLSRLRRLPGVRKVFVASGVRHDLVLADRKQGPAYLEQLVRHHVSGQLKLAPEHSQPNVLARMGKPKVEMLLEFKRQFDRINRRLKKKQFLTYYFIAAHPGCRDGDMQALRQFAIRRLHLLPEQVQIFTPTPTTWSTAMYCTGMDPADGQNLYVPRDSEERNRQLRVMAAGPAPGAGAQSRR